MDDKTENNQPDGWLYTGNSTKLTWTPGRKYPWYKRLWWRVLDLLGWL